MAGSIKRLAGSVKWFDTYRGFGFITPEGGGDDIFVHRTSIKAAGCRYLTDGQSVEFVVSMGDDGRSSAVSVTGPGGSSIDRLTGSVKWFNCDRGYGFITPEGGGEDLFFHRSSVKSMFRPSLTEGKTVEFVVCMDDDGRLRAFSVTGRHGSFIDREDYWTNVWFCCNELGDMDRDCKSIVFINGFLSDHSGGDIETLTRGFPATQPTNPLNPLNLGSFSPLPAKGKTIVGQVSEGMNSKEEEAEDETEDGAEDETENEAEDETEEESEEEESEEEEESVEEEEEEESEEEEAEEEESEVSSEDNEPKSGMEWRNWAELPRDTLSKIFKKIGAAEILSSAQSVCRPWRQLSHDPAIWRCVDLRYDGWDDMVSMAMMAVDRSMGFMEELCMEYFPTDELMHYIAERATRLRGLHLISIGMYEETLAETLRKLPLLEELEMSRCCCFSDEVLEKVGLACPQLKSFILNERVYSHKYQRESDSDKNLGALAIAKHFKQLRRLRLFANCLTNAGLLAILDNCPHLEHLDVRYCFNVDFLDENLKNKCARIKHLRLPNDSVADYEYMIDEVVTDGPDINPHLSDTDTDYDFGYGYEDYINFDYYGFSDLSDSDYDHV